jgi:hypothetical protein
VQNLSEQEWVLLLLEATDTEDRQLTAVRARSCGILVDQVLRFDERYR